MRQACAEMDEQLRAGQSCRVERFFSLYPLLACQEDHALELIYTEFATREELDQRPTPEEYYARFPHWRKRLQRQFQVHELLRDNLETSEETASRLPALEQAGPQVGQRLGGYELLELLARGGCGVVFRAWQQGLERTVALKVLRPELACSLPARQRFCQEARVMASLRCRHIMPVHDIGESDGVLFFSMDFAASGSLALRIAERQGQSPEPAVRADDFRILAAVADAVHYAHQQGVVHGDLKPSNLLLDEHGEPLVSDFGLARPAETAAESISPFAGTPAYMAPELLDGRPATVVSDVWALGVIAYEMVMGSRPFHGSRLAELRRRVEALPETLPNDERLAALLRRCLAADPADRFASAAELADVLSACAHPL